ncbi:hypothetical protein BKA81DRAFT_345964 [Phyllosticta paracitricarpa]
MCTWSSRSLLYTCTCTILSTCTCPPFQVLHDTHPIHPLPIEIHAEPNPAAPAEPRGEVIQSGSRPTQPGQRHAMQPKEKTGVLNATSMPTGETTTTTATAVKKRRATPGHARMHERMEAATACLAPSNQHPQWHTVVFVAQERNDR